jgi:NAD(P)H-dependent flavin oxidoreductase YrpB (nitropropane dioxygenase family)
MKTRITELFGIKHPIIQGGMHRVGYAEMAAAVSNGGGLGIITGLTQPTPEDLAREIGRCRDMTDQPFGVNWTFLPSFAAPPDPEYIDATVEGGVRIVETAGRNPAQYIPALKAHGVKGHPQMHLGASFADRRADRLRRDQRRRVRVRRSSGRRRRPQYDPAAPGCRGAEDPVCGSGGIADGRSLVAALAAPASAVQPAGVACLQTGWQTVQTPQCGTKGLSRTIADEQNQWWFSVFARAFPSKVSYALRGE